MIFRKKSTLEKVLDTVVNATTLLGANGNIRRPSRFSRYQNRLNFLLVAAPLIWSNRDKIRKVADTALRQAQSRLEASKQALKGAAPAEAQQTPQQPPAPQEIPQPQAEQNKAA